MSTNSTIALEFLDGSVSQVYCHWDGYLEHNGRILVEHYSNPFKLQTLINLGDISVLGPEIGVKHPFENPYRIGTPEYQAHKDQYGIMTKFYGRDCGEDDIEAEDFVSFDDYLQNRQSQDYDYILRTDGNWYVSKGGDQFLPLTFDKV